MQRKNCYADLFSGKKASWNQVAAVMIHRVMIHFRTKNLSGNDENWLISFCGHIVIDSADRKNF